MKRKAKWDKFEYKLNNLNRFKVRTGRLQKIGTEFTQKGVDVKLVIDFVQLAYSGKIDKAIIITGDSDFVPMSLLEFSRSSVIPSMSESSL